MGKITTETKGKIQAPDGLKKKREKIQKNPNGPSTVHNIRVRLH